MKPIDPKASLGAILVAMGAIDEDQLSQAVSDQQRLRDEHLIGKILVANGACTAKQLDVAIEAQKGMRSSKGADKAIAVADLALARRRRDTLHDRRVRIQNKSVLILEAAKAAEGTKH